MNRRHLLSIFLLLHILPAHALVCNGKKVQGFVWADMRKKRAIAFSGQDGKIAIHRCLLGEGRDPHTCKLLFIDTFETLCQQSELDNVVFHWLPIFFSVGRTVATMGGSGFLEIGSKVMAVGENLITVSDGIKHELERSKCPRAELAKLMMENPRHPFATLPTEVQKQLKIVTKAQNKLENDLLSSLGLKRFQLNIPVSQSKTIGKSIMHYGQMGAWELYHTTLISLDKKSLGIKDLDGQLCPALSNPDLYKQMLLKQSTPHSEQKSIGK